MFESLRRETPPCAKLYRAGAVKTVSLKPFGPYQVIRMSCGSLKRTEVRALMGCIMPPGGKAPIAATAPYGPIAGTGKMPRPGKYPGTPSVPVGTQPPRAVRCTRSGIWPSTCMILPPLVSRPSARMTPESWPRNAVRIIGSPCGPM